MRKFTLVFLILCIQYAIVTAQVVADFAPSVLSGCPPLTVNFQNLSTGATTYSWNFGNSSSPSALQNPTTNYGDAGIYNVELIARNGSQSDTQYIQIRVFAPPTVNFVSPNPQGCNTPCHTVNFTNQTIPGESAVQPANYIWDFGDGTQPEPGYNASHCYPNTGTFTVTLIARDDNGCQSSKIVPNFVTITAGPVANASATPTQSCASSQLVNFTGTGSSPNGAITYSWNFGNGNSVQQNLAQTFTCGVYNPVLTVTDPIGCTNTSSVQIDVPCLNADFTSVTTNGCIGIPVQFTDASNYSGTWAWDFGDSDTSTLEDPTHTYAAAGTYAVTLTVTYAGCTDTETKTAYITITAPVNFTLSADNYSSCIAPLTVNFTNTAVGATGYTWSFGDGDTSALANPTYTYNTTGTFTVTLGIPNAAGCVNTQTLSSPISVGALQAGFTLTPPNGCSQLTVQFTNTSTSNTTITSYNWQFGDGPPNGTTQNPLHIYTTGGQYTPILTVIDNNGCSATYTYPGTIDVGTTLVPDFIANPLVQCVNQNISFTNLTPGTTSATTYLWEFASGGADYSTDRDPIHQFSDTGFYTISLTVINQGCTSVIVKQRYIQIVVPKADFSTTFTCSNPTSVTFTDASQGAETWSWDFGDGTLPFSTLQNPVHNYATPGNYTVTLTVTNNTTGCTDLKQFDLNVGRPRAGFTSNVVEGCTNLNVQFTDTSAYSTAWLWRFGDGATSTSNQQNPSHTYNTPGIYTVTLVINPGGTCSDSMVKTSYITVYGITGNISPSVITGCTPMSVTFTPYLTSYLGTVTSYQWTFPPGTGTSSVPNPTHIYTFGGTQYAVLVATDSRGCTASFTKSVIPRDVVAGFVADTTGCPGEALQFTNQGSNTTSHLWNFGDDSISYAINPTHAYANSGTYTVTLISSMTGSCPDTMVRTSYITVETPKVDFYSNTTFSPCPPFPVKFYNTTNRTDLQWLWYFGDGDTSTAREPLHVYFFPGDYDVTLIGWNAIGCRDTMTYVDMIKVRGPIGNFVVSADSGCVPLTVSFSGTVQSTVSIVSDLGDGEAVNNTLNITHQYKEVGNYYPVFTLTDSLGCRVSYPVDTVVVGLIPYPNLPKDTNVCRGNYVQFDLPLGDHFQWLANGNTNYLDCDTCRQPTSSARDTITYFVTATTNIGCVAKDTVTVNVDALPQIYPGLHFRICPNDTLQLSAGNNVAAATWQPNLYINNTNIVNPLVWPPDTMTYRVTGGNSTGCTISRIVKVWPIQKVVADLTTGDTLQCEGGSVPLDVTVLQSSFNDTSFQWIPSRYLNSSTIKNPVLTAPAGDYIYTVIVRSSTCVADTETVHIVSAPNPTAEAGDEQVVAEGTTIQLWAASPDNVTYTWLPQTDALTCTDCRKPHITVTKEQTVPVIVTTQYGCTDTAYVKLRVVTCDDKMVFVPNTFTPNNDDLNDRLFVRGAGLRSLEYFRVFDRWGKLVWETRNLNEGWDGTVNGKKSDLATYVYLLKGECSSGAEVQKSGNVTLVR